MGNSTVIQLLNEIEKLIDQYLLDFKLGEEASKDTFTSEATKIKKD